jgi:hypothetical protein
MEKKQVLGVDIGNVIINNRFNDLKSLDEAGYAALPVQEGSCEGLKKLNEYFNGNVYLISKCTVWAELQMSRWLKNHDFFNATGIKEEHVYSVRERIEKDAICRKLGITHFIDDRLEVLGHLVESTQHLFLFEPDKDEVKKYEKFLSRVTVVNNWEELVNKIIIQSK